MNATDIGILMFKQLIFRGYDFLHYLSGNSSWMLHPYEKIVIDAAVNYLVPDIRSLVQAQLKKSFFVERMSDRRINVFRFYDYEDVLRVLDPEFSDLLLNVELAVDGKKHIAHVTFYKGYIFSIEFKKPSKFYAGKEVKIGNVILGNPKQSYTGAIDRLEHGKETDYNP